LFRGVDQVGFFRVVQLFQFSTKKSEACFFHKKNPRRTPWTVLYRRLHHKGHDEEVAKRRTRRTVKYQRAIVGASLETIIARRSEKKEVREVAREAALRYVGAAAFTFTRCCCGCVVSAGA
jgi:large subunit ribosomal protein L24e